MSSFETNERALVATMSASGRRAARSAFVLPLWSRLSAPDRSANSQYAGGTNEVDLVARANENESELIAPRNVPKGGQRSASGGEKRKKKR